jgi:transcription-repair coupling factor (superfamily II helicase)
LAAGHERDRDAAEGPHGDSDDGGEVRREDGALGVEVELERGGQVYFVHNRVETIYEIAGADSGAWCRGARCRGHGQMGETELERVMLAFMRHEYDVLVATTIIENGLDIPLANTI